MKTTFHSPDILVREIVNQITSSYSVSVKLLVHAKVDFPSNSVGGR